MSPLRKEMLDAGDFADYVAGDDCSLFSGDLDMAGFLEDDIDLEVKDADKSRNR
ncbi:MAG: hypothetical protein ABSA39_00245 [Edaphobacter sp.]